VLARLRAVALIFKAVPRFRAGSNLRSLRAKIAGGGIPRRVLDKADREMTEIAANALTRRDNGERSLRRSRSAPGYNARIKRSFRSFQAGATKDRHRAAIKPTAPRTMRRDTRATFRQNGKIERG